MAVKSRHPETLALHAGWRADPADPENFRRATDDRTRAYYAETLPLRMARHCENAMKVAEFLEKRPDVTRVIYPGLAAGEAKARAAKYMRGGFGGLLGFELAGGAEAGKRFIGALEMFYHVANIGDARSLAIHPASTTHSQLSPEEQAQTGTTPGYVRLSIGLEHIDDILADLAQALDRAA